MLNRRSSKLICKENLSFVKMAPFVSTKTIRLRFFTIQVDVVRMWSSGKDDLFECHVGIADRVGCGYVQE